MRFAVSPGLLSLETKLPRVRGSYLWGGLDYFPPPSDPHAYHYAIRQATLDDQPRNYTFRAGYFWRSAEFWHYRRELGGSARLEFQYDPHQRTFHANRLMATVPIELGGIAPLGRHVADMMSLDLFVAGMAVVRSVSYRYDGKVTCCVLPSFNGKTTLMTALLRAGAEYIAEDLSVVDFVKDRLYGLAPRRHNFGREANRLLFDQVQTRSEEVVEGAQLDRVIALNHGVGASPVAEVEPLPLLFANSFFFANSLFIRSYVAVEGLWSAVNEQCHRLADYWVRKCERFTARNFEFSHVIDAPI